MNEELISRNAKDPDLKGIYVRRCKCGGRPYLDRIAIVPTPWWLKCNCGYSGESGDSPEEAAKFWNEKKRIKYS